MTGFTIDLFLSLAALAGLMAVDRTIRRRDPDDPVNRRFRFALAVAMALFAGRAALSVTGLGLFATLIRLSAALVPLAVLIVTEGLLRRHAPGWAKVLVGGGTLPAVLVALWPSGPAIDPEDLALMAFQIAGFLVSGWLVATRDRAGLSAAENRAVAGLGLSLLLFVPLAAADFLGPWLGLPVRVAGLAALALCWLAVTLGRAEAGADAARGLAAILGAGGAATLAIGGADWVATGAAVLAALLLAAVISDATALRVEEQSLSLLRLLSEEPAGLLRALVAHPLVEGAVVVEGAALADLDPRVLRRAFAGAPVLRRGAAVAGTDEGETLRLLFDRYGATHLMLAGDDPPRVVALAMPVLATAPRAEAELAAVARMVRLAEGSDGG